MLECIKFVKKETSKPTSAYFSYRERNLNMILRNLNNQTLQLPQPRSEREKRFITYHGPKLWNSIPENIKNIRNPVTLKINVKKMLIHQY